MQDVILPGDDAILAQHPDGQDLTGCYGALTVPAPTGGTWTAPACEIVQTPRGFVYAIDELGRLLDPRRFAGPGGTPLEPGGKIVPRPEPPPERRRA